MVNQNFKQGLIVSKHLIGTNKIFLIFLVYLYISNFIMKCHTERAIQRFPRKAISQEILSLHSVLKCLTE